MNNLRVIDVTWCELGENTPKFKVNRNMWNQKSLKRKPKSFNKTLISDEFLLNRVHEQIEILII